MSMCPNERFEDDDPFGSDSPQRQGKPIHMPLPPPASHTDIPSSSSTRPPKLADYGRV